MKSTTPTVLGMKYDVIAVPAETMNIINNLQRRKKICFKRKKILYEYVTYNLNIWNNYRGWVDIDEPPRPNSKTCSIAHKKSASGGGRVPSAHRKGKNINRMCKIWFICSRAGTFTVNLQEKENNYIIRNYRRGSSQEKQNNTYTPSTSHTILYKGHLQKGPSPNLQQLNTHKLWLLSFPYFRNYPYSVVSNFNT